MEDDAPGVEVAASDRPGLASDIGKRVISGIAFAAAAVLLAWAGEKPFALLVLIVALVMSWEWARMVRGAEFDTALIVHASAVVAATFLTAFGYAALGLFVLVIGSIIVLLLQFGARPLYSAAGVLYAGLPAVAILWVRGDEPMGFLAVLFIFLVVWATDTAAFLSGRLVGGPKLAPRISPNKTWAGLGGGILAGGLTALAFALIAGGSPLTLAATGLVMALVAQGGDLLESALKRTFGVKDASNLVPGHGGVLDRVDGVVAVAIATALAALFLNAHAPAEALLSRL